MKKTILIAALLVLAMAGAAVAQTVTVLDQIEKLPLPPRAGFTLGADVVSTSNPISLTIPSLPANTKTIALTFGTTGNFAACIKNSCVTPRPVGTITNGSAWDYNPKGYKIQGISGTLPTKLYLDGFDATTVHVSINVYALVRE